MKYLKKHIVAVVLLSAFSTIIFSQERTEYKTLIMGVPQYLIKSGVRIDIERKISNTHWISFAPIVYMKDNFDRIDTTENYYGYSDYYSSYEYRPIVNKMYGLGLGVSSVYILKNAEQFKRQFTFYVSYGVSYTFFNFNVTERMWVPYVNEEGLSVQHKVPNTYDIHSSKLGGDVVFGIRKEIVSRLFVDAYLGFGLRYSFHDLPEGSTVELNSSFIDYGYSGTTLVGGLRLGVAL